MASPNPPPPPPMAPTWSALPNAPRHMVIELWSFLGFWLRAIGFLLVFLGTLIVVVAATPGGGCYTSAGSCGTGFLGQAANAIYAAKLLWVLGLGGIGAGAGIRLHWGLRASRDTSSEELQLISASRRANWTAVVLSIVLMLVLLLISGAVAGPAIIP